MDCELHEFLQYTLSNFDSELLQHTPSKFEMCRRQTSIDSQSRVFEVGSDIDNDSLGSLVSVIACLWYQGLLKKKMDRNLTLVTFDQELCQLVLIWFMTLPSEPCHNGGVFDKKDGQKPNPSDF